MKRLRLRRQGRRKGRRWQNNNTGGLHRPEHNKDHIYQDTVNFVFMQK